MGQTVDHLGSQVSTYRFLLITRAHIGRYGTNEATLFPVIGTFTSCHPGAEPTDSVWAVWRRLVTLYRIARASSSVV